MSDFKYDLFISHASEDKSTFVRPLVALLRELKLSVWYDEHSLTVGDSLSASIDAGLREARFGLVVLSPHFLAKPWPKYEYRSLVALEHDAERRILPVWLNVGRDDIVAFSPHLADKVAVVATSNDPLETALSALRVARPEFHQQLKRLAAAEIISTPISDLTLSPVGPPMTKDQLLRLRLIHEALYDVHPTKWDKLVSDFRRDSLSGRDGEIAIWEAIAGVYLKTCRKFSLTDTEKKSLYSNLLQESLEETLPKTPDIPAWLRFAREQYHADLQTVSD